jgi:hypothetical protein
MDSALRRRFLQMLGFDFAGFELNAMNIKNWEGRARWVILGPQNWPRVRAWWLSRDPTPVTRENATTP